MVQGVKIEDGFLLDMDPSTGELIEKVKVSTLEDINRKVIKAKAAQVSWELVPLEERIKKLKEAVALLKDPELASKMAKMISREMGKITQEAQEEVGLCSDVDDVIDMIYEANKDEEVNESSCIVRDPLGVVAIISPWNFPVGEIIFLVLPALAAGNGIVVKPSEVAPLSGEMIVLNTVMKVLPEGLVSVLQGDGAVGKALVEHDDVNMVAMTGSSAVGKKIMESASKKLKRIVLELGGKCPMIVFKDADIEKAAKDAVYFSLMNCGQVCCSVERVYVDANIKSEFVEKCAEFLKEYKAGNSFDPETKIGPMVSQLQKTIVQNQINDAVKNGAKIICKAEAPVTGNFVPATLLSDVTQDMKICREETFGPVVSVLEFDGSEMEAIKLSNDTEYGLTASIYSSDLAKAKNVARSIKAGQIAINANPIVTAPLLCPWAGSKGSGFGSRSGKDGYRQFSVPKSLVNITA